MYSYFGKFQCISLRLTVAKKKLIFFCFSLFHLLRVYLYLCRFFQNMDLSHFLVEGAICIIYNSAHHEINR